MKAARLLSYYSRIHGGKVPEIISALVLGTEELGKLKPCSGLSFRTSVNFTKPFRADADIHIGCLNSATNAQSRKFWSAVLVRFMELADRVSSVCGAPLSLDFARKLLFQINTRFYRSPALKFGFEWDIKTLKFSRATLYMGFCLKENDFHSAGELLPVEIRNSLSKFSPEELDCAGVDLYPGRPETFKIYSRLAYPVPALDSWSLTTEKALLRAGGKISFVYFMERFGFKNELVSKKVYFHLKSPMKAGPVLGIFPETLREKAGLLPAPASELPFYFFSVNPSDKNYFNAYAR